MHPWVRELLSFSLLSLSAVFFVVDPMGVVPVFVAMTQGDSDEKRRRMAKRASITAFAILTFFAVAGMAIFPLAIPLLAGPGAIATVTALMGRAGRTVFMVPVVLSVAVTCAASYAMLRAAVPISRLLGVTGLNVMNRVIGLIIGAIAVQFIFDGLKDTFPRLF